MGLCLSYSACSTLILFSFIVTVSCYGILVLQVVIVILILSNEPSAIDLPKDGASLGTRGGIIKV